MSPSRSAIAFRLLFVGVVCAGAWQVAGFRGAVWAGVGCVAVVALARLISEKTRRRR